MLKLDSNETQLLLWDFYYLSGMKLCIFDQDYNEVAYSSPSKRCPFCAYMRQDPVFDANCRACDKQAMINCRKSGQSFFYRCHIGFKEFVAPVFYDGAVVGYMVIGQVTDGSEEEWSVIRGNLEKYPDVDTVRAKELYKNLPHFTNNIIESAGRIVDACVSHIYHKRMLDVRHMDLSQQIEQYITANICEDLSIDHLCGRFEISRSEIYRLFEQRFGTSVADFIRNKRIFMAEELIRNTDQKISEIAQTVGFYDYNYFSKVFRKSYGVSPREYRRGAK